MGTLHRFGFYGEVPAGSRHADDRACPPQQIGNPRERQVRQVRRVTPGRLPADGEGRGREADAVTHACTSPSASCVPMDQVNLPNPPNLPTGFENKDLEAAGSQGEPAEPAVWHADIEGRSRRSVERSDWRRPRPLPSGSVVARLCAAGATVRTYGLRGGGATAEIEAPAGIPAELMREVERRGWRIIPGGKPNPEAEHDSWLAGVAIADLGR